MLMRSLTWALSFNVEPGGMHVQLNVFLSIVSWFRPPVTVG